MKNAKKLYLVATLCTVTLDILLFLPLTVTVCLACNCSHMDTKEALASQRKTVQYGTLLYSVHNRQANNHNLHIAY
jgi:hypothetical protein